MRKPRRITRWLATIIVATGLGAGISAPAHADTGWDTTRIHHNR